MMILLKEHLRYIRVCHLAGFIPSVQSIRCRALRVFHTGNCLGAWTTEEEERLKVLVPSLIRIFAVSSLCARHSTTKWDHLGALLASECIAMKLLCATSIATCWLGSELVPIPFPSDVPFVSHVPYFDTGSLNDTEIQRLVDLVRANHDPSKNLGAYTKLIVTLTLTLYLSPDCPLFPKRGIKWAAVAAEMGPAFPRTYLSDTWRRSHAMIAGNLCTGIWFVLSSTGVAGL